MTLSAGSVLKDNLVLERELGRGGMGTVWLAENRSLGSKVAVKVLLAGDLGESARTRFAKEARAVARLDSPHVVKIFDFGVTDDGEPFFVMELLRGRDLQARLDADGPLPVHEFVGVFDQLCRALGRAHEAGLVHRDVKPANVFLLEGDAFVKVLDFGIAKDLGAGDMGVTRTGAVMGTPLYMSLEQLTSPGTVDHRTDLWSAAVLAYAALTGALPFVGATVPAIALAVSRGAFEPPSARNPALRIELDAWFERALDVDLDRRFGSARELAESFRVAALGVTVVPSSAASVEPATAPRDGRRPPVEALGALSTAEFLAGSMPPAAPGTGRGSIEALGGTDVEAVRRKTPEIAPTLEAWPAPRPQTELASSAARGPEAALTTNAGVVLGGATEVTARPDDAPGYAPRPTPAPLVGIPPQRPGASSGPAADEPPAATGEVHRTARTALLLGIGSLLTKGLLAVPALWLAWKARREIAAAPRRYTNERHATWALVLGALGLLSAGTIRLTRKEPEAERSDAATAERVERAARKVEVAVEEAGRTIEEAADELDETAAGRGGPTATSPTAAADGSSARPPTEGAPPREGASSEPEELDDPGAPAAPLRRGDVAPRATTPVKRNITCKAGANACIPCCPKGDVLGPFPACECFIKP